MSEALCIARKTNRLVHELLGSDLQVEMLIFADDLEALGGDVDGRRGIVCAYVLLLCFGFPSKWSKQRGGMQVEWIGFLLTTHL